LAHILTSLLGLCLLFLILRSMVRIALINRHYRDFFAETAGRTVHAVVSLRLRGKRGTRASHPVLLWLFTAYLLSLILVYFLWAMAAFVLLYWGTGAVISWRQAFLASGSALNTLGFATPTTIAGQWLAIPEGALGLGIVVFLFTFIPGYQAVIRSREDKTSWLYIRTGDQPEGVALLEWCQRAGIAHNMRDVWETWEDWFRMLGDTHSVLPMLTMSPSVQGNQSWVRAAAAVLDAAALAASSLDTEDTEPAKACVQTGARALLAIANALGQTCKSARQPITRPSRMWYEATRARLGSVGLPLRSAVDGEPRWREFLSFREQYEDALLFVASQTFAPLEGIEIGLVERGGTPDFMKCARPSQFQETGNGRRGPD
jgi:hypothetical protein